MEFETRRAEHRQALADLEQRRKEGGAISDKMIDEARRQVAFDDAEAAARDRARAARVAAGTAQDTVYQERQTQLAQAAEAAYKRECRRRAGYGVSDQEFDRDLWPELRRSWLLRQATGDGGAGAGIDVPVIRL